MTHGEKKTCSSIFSIFSFFFWVGFFLFFVFFFLSETLKSYKEMHLNLHRTKADAESCN